MPPCRLYVECQGETTEHTRTLLEIRPPPAIMRLTQIASARARRNGLVSSDRTLHWWTSRPVTPGHNERLCLALRRLTASRQTANLQPAANTLAILKPNYAGDGTHMPTDRLYHYTTPDGLIGIVKTNALWATSVFYLNDSRELIGGIEIAQDYLRNIRDTTNVQQQIDRVEWLLNDILDFGKAFHTKPVFVASLTTQSDQLSQWRAYCQGGGFAIGFPADQLRECVKSQHCSLQECIYEKDKQRKLMRSVIDSMARPWIESSQLPVEEDNDRFKISGQLAWELLRAASRIKDESFEEEREARIISLPERPCKADAIQFRSRNGLIVPYISVELPNDIEFWGSVHIVVGPTPYPTKSKASIYDLVRRYRGHAIGIEISRTPYREW